MTNIWDCIGWGQEWRNRDEQREKKSKWAGSFETTDTTSIEEAWKSDVSFRNEPEDEVGTEQHSTGNREPLPIAYIKVSSMLVGQGVLIKLGVSRTGCANRCLVMMYGVFSSSQTVK